MYIVNTLELIWFWTGGILRGRLSIYNIVMWKKVSSRRIFDHPRLTLIEDIVELPNGKRVPYLKYDGDKSAVVIICQDANRVLLQKEYSYPLNEPMYQFPGGAVEDDEEPIAGAKRELIEEAGLKAKKLKEIGWFYPNNRRSDKKMHAFLASSCVEAEKKGGDMEEDISSYWTEIDKLNEMIKQGEIVNHATLAAWFFFMQL